MITQKATAVKNACGRDRNSEYGEAQARLCLFARPGSPDRSHNRQIWREQGGQVQVTFRIPGGNSSPRRHLSRTIPTLAPPGAALLTLSRRTSAGGPDRAGSGEPPTPVATPLPSQRSTQLAGSHLSWRTHRPDGPASGASGGRGRGRLPSGRACRWRSGGVRPRCRGT